MLKSSLLFFAVALLVVVYLPMAGRNPQAAPSAPAQNSAPAAKNPARPTAESQVKAKELYTRDCALCHGDAGNGKSDAATSMNLTMDDWTNPATLAGKSESDLFAVIRSGKGDKMPSEDANRADDTAIRNLITYIRSLSKNQPPAAAPAPAPAPATNQP